MLLFVYSNSLNKRRQILPIEVLKNQKNMVPMLSKAKSSTTMVSQTLQKRNLQLKPKVEKERKRSNQFLSANNSSHFIPLKKSSKQKSMLIMSFYDLFKLYYLPFLTKMQQKSFTIQLQRTPKITNQNITYPRHMRQSLNHLEQKSRILLPRQNSSIYMEENSTKKQSQIKTLLPRLKVSITHHSAEQVYNKTNFLAHNNYKKNTEYKQLYINYYKHKVKTQIVNEIRDLNELLRDPEGLPTIQQKLKILNYFIDIDGHKNNSYMLFDA